MNLFLCSFSPSVEVAQQVTMIANKQLCLSLLLSRWYLSKRCTQKNYNMYHVVEVTPSLALPQAAAKEIPLSDPLLFLDFPKLLFKGRSSLPTKGLATNACGNSIKSPLSAPANRSLSRSTSIPLLNII